MNSFLHINKKLIIFFILLIFILLFFLLFSKTDLFFFKDIDEIKILYQDSKYDIIEPKFIINNNKNKILVTANQGNFIGDNNILLKEQVHFKSKNFSIYTNEVLFNQAKQTADSNNKSTFVAEKTKVQSEGFKILDKGNIIIFNGNSKIILSQWNI